MVSSILMLLAGLATQVPSQSPLDLLPVGTNPTIPVQARERLEHAVGRWHVRAERIDPSGRVAGVVEWENEAHFSSRAASWS